MQTRFGTNVPSTPYHQVFSVNCFKEAQEPITMIKVGSIASRYQYQIPYSCPLDQAFIDTTHPPLPVSWVWTIDVSQSMGPTIAAIKNSLDNMASIISERNWGVQFAAIGFVDAFFQSKVSNFSDAHSAKNFINANWSASGGGSDAEGGQEALIHALRLLNIQQEKAPTAKRYIVYASDAMMHIETQGDSTNYSIDPLVQAFKADGGKNVHLWYSIPDDPKGKAKGGYAGPKAQMKDFIKKAGIADAIELPFPINADAIVAQFKQTFRTTTTELTLNCYATTATLQSKSDEAGVQSISDKDIAAITKSGKLVDFASSPDVNVYNYNLTINRCCKIREIDPECVVEQKKILPIQFADPNTLGTQ